MNWTLAHPLAATLVTLGFISQMDFQFMKGYVSLSWVLYWIPFPVRGKKNQKEQRNKKDKKWLMWVIIFKILANTVLPQILFIVFLLALWETNPFGNLTYWKSIDFSQPFLKSKSIIMAFLKHKKRCLTLIIRSFYWFGWLNTLSLD